MNCKQRIRGAPDGFRKFRRRESAYPAGNSAGKYGHPAVGRAQQRAACAKSEGVRAKAEDLARAAQYAVGKDAAFRWVNAAEDFAQSSLLRDQHRRAAAMLPQAVSRVDQGGEGVGEAVFAQRDLDVPAILQVPTAAQQQTEHEKPHKKARPARLGEGAEARRSRITAEDAQRAFEDAQRPAPAQQKICGGGVDGQAQQRRRVRQEEKEQGRAQQKRLRPQQGAQLQMIQRELGHQQDDEVHQQIQRQK